MSTFPLVQVEGALAIPRMRPLNRVPPPFGREWLLMPPHFSLRAELQAFYAAILRTVCLSAQAFREAYRWDSHRRVIPEPPRPAAAPVAGTLNAAQAQQAAADTLQPPVAGTRRGHTARVERTPPPSHKLAASAVAIGGAVLLTWIVASHTQFGEGKNKPAPRAPATPASAEASASERLANTRTRHEFEVSGAVQGPQSVAAPVSATMARVPGTPAAARRATPESADNGVAIGSTIVEQHSAPRATAAAAASLLAAAPSTASPQRTIGSTEAAHAAPRQGAESAPLAGPIAVPAQAIAGAPAAGMPAAGMPAAGMPATSSSSGTTAARRPDFTARTHANAPLRATLTSKATRADRATAKATKGDIAAHARTRTTYKEAARHRAHEFAPHRSAPLVTTQHILGGYSEAAEYSPRQPAVTSSDEYPSLTTYAGTHMAPRPASRATVNVDSTEWVNHVSQRRVTDVPDRFAK